MEFHATGTHVGDLVGRSSSASVITGETPGQFLPLFLTPGSRPCTELEAVADVLADARDPEKGPLRIASVKSNIG